MSPVRVVPPDDDLRRTALDRLPNRIPAPSTTYRYRAGLAAAAAVMVALPLLYAALAALTAFGVYRHVISNSWLLKGGGAFRFFAYFAPIVAGAMLVLVLFRPLFSRLPEPADRRRLTPEEEPFLFDFVRKLCAAVGAPELSEVVVDLQVNAFAGADLGLVRAKRGRLVLGIGLPLVAGLSLTQFAGVLAHEFGHFSQGAGMRLSRVIRSIHLWFARVIYERGEWDQTVEGWKDSNFGYLALLGALTYFCLSLARVILSALMTAGQVVSGFFLRQMELDADRYETRLVGPTVFESTMRALECLAQASAKAYGELAEAAKWGILPEDLPAAIARRMSESPSGASPVDNVGGRTRLLDTHPSDRERIEHAQAESLSSAFEVEARATLLFRDFEGLSREVTLAHYRAAFGTSVDETHLVPDEELGARTAKAKANLDLVETFYMGLVDFRTPFFPSLPQERSGSETAALETLEEARARLQASLLDARRARKTCVDAEFRRFQAAVALYVLRNGLPIPKRSSEWTEDEAAASARRARDDRDAGLQGLVPFHDAMQSRIAAALALESDPGALGRASHGLELLSALKGLAPAIRAVHDEIATVRALLAEYDSSPPNARKGQLAIERLRANPIAAMANLPAIPNFQLSAEGETPRTLSELLGAHPGQHGYESAVGLIQAYYGLYFSTLSELALRVREIESRLHLPEIGPRTADRDERDARRRRFKSNLRPRHR